MRKLQRKASWFLALACLVILTCMAQRTAGFVLLQTPMASVQATSVATDNTADIGAPVTPCELSAKSLMSVPPILAEALLSGLCVLLAVLVFTPRLVLPATQVYSHSTPRRRIHLRLCNFRE